MKEMHGVPNARKLTSTGTSETQEVTVKDGDKLVHLCLGSFSTPAGLTPEEARWIARQLTLSAARVEHAYKLTPKNEAPK